MPDDEWVRRERRAVRGFATGAGDHVYRYPARYLGRDVVDQRVPDERVPVSALQRVHRVRLGPAELPAVVTAVEACGDRLVVRRRC